MIQLLLIIAGVVGLATDEQFHGQYAISAVLLGLGVLLALIQLVAFLFVARKVRETNRRFTSNWGRNL